VAFDENGEDMSKLKTIDDIEQTISIDEFMQQFHIKSKATFHAWVRNGRMKTCKVGKRRTIPVSEVARLMKEGTKYGM
jgi:predicted site-specific integrase-resolvase